MLRGPDSTIMLDIALFLGRGCDYTRMLIGMYMYVADISKVRRHILYSHPGTSQSGSLSLRSLVRGGFSRGSVVIRGASCLTLLIPGFPILGLPRGCS